MLWVAGGGGVVFVLLLLLVLVVVVVVVVVVVIVVVGTIVAVHIPADVYDSRMAVRALILMMVIILYGGLRLPNRSSL